MQITRKNLYYFICFIPPLLFIFIPGFPRFMHSVFIAHLVSWSIKTFLDTKIKIQFYNMAYSVLHMALITYLTYGKLTALAQESIDENFLYIELFYIFILFLIILGKMTPINKIKNIPRGAIIIMASISIWVLFALFLPFYTSSKYENINIIVESFFIIMVFAPPIGIAWGIYKLFFSRK